MTLTNPIQANCLKEQKFDLTASSKDSLDLCSYMVKTYHDQNFVIENVR